MLVPPSLLVIVSGGRRGDERSSVGSQQVSADLFDREGQGLVGVEERLT